ncbi:MAG: hypothetical protein U1B83_07255 [Candidatus Cloacimonadaceae bacterium]|nr:hypothetical protein [Candidatus Cloacimonadaceae bacterium]
MRILHIISMLILGTALFATPYAGEIFNVSPGVLNQAMGNTGLTYVGSVSAGWWNPALLGANPAPGIELVRSEHFEGLMQQNQLSLIYGGKTRTSLQINHLGIDRVKLTQLENEADTLSNDNRPIVWKTVSNNDFILTAGIARRLGTNLYMGISPKLAYRSLAENSGYGFGADLGIFWDSGIGLTTAANLRDFFSTQIIWENGTHEIAVPSLDLEAAWGFGMLSQSIPVHLALRTQIYAEDRGEASQFAAGIFSGDFHAGLLVKPIPSLRLMTGWDVDSFTAGMGVDIYALGIDYAFKNGAPDGLGATQRIALSYRW